MYKCRAQKNPGRAIQGQRSDVFVAGNEIELEGNSAFHRAIDHTGKITTENKPGFNMPLHNTASKKISLSGPFKGSPGYLQIQVSQPPNS